MFAFLKTEHTEIRKRRNSGRKFWRVAVISLNDSYTFYYFAVFLIILKTCLNITGWFAMILETEFGRYFFMLTKDTSITGNAFVNPLWINGCTSGCPITPRHCRGLKLVSFGQYPSPIKAPILQGIETFLRSPKRKKCFRVPLRPGAAFLSSRQALPLWGICGIISESFCSFANQL